jgi:MFS family permease
MASESIATVGTSEVRGTSAPSGGETARLAMASMIGTSLEWYEFTIYNSMAALIFNKLFFPSFDPIAGTILAFSTYAVGYVSRPFGGLFFGRLGDRLGRRAVLIFTLAMMGVTTLAMGLLPTYAMIGVAAPVLLVALRFFQGIALGGEWAGAVLLSVEHGKTENRGLNASWAQMGPSMGTLMAAGVIAMVTNFQSDEAFLSWGWRIPFLLSAVLIVFGFWIRRSVEETPLFSSIEAKGDTAKAPIKEVMKFHWRKLLIAGGVRIGSDVVYGLLAVVTLTYVTQRLGLTRNVALSAVFLGSALHVFAVPLMAGLSDRFGRKVVYGSGAVASIIWAFVFFEFMNTKQPALIILAVCVGMVFQAAMFGPQGAFITEQFETRVRYTGSSLAYTFAGVLGGAFAPLIFVTLLKEYTGTIALSVYVTVALLVTLAALFSAKETARRQID